MSRFDGDGTIEVRQIDKRGAEVFVEGEFKFDRRDIAEAQANAAGRRVHRASPRTERLIAGAAWILVIALALVLFSDPALWHPWFPFNDVQKRMHLIAGLAVLGMGILIVGYVWFAVFRRLRLRSTSELRGSVVTVAVLEDGIALTTGGVRNEYAWSYFERFDETPRIFVLYHPGNLMRVIPKVAFRGEAEQNLFRRHLLLNIPAPSAMRSA